MSNFHSIANNRRYLHEDNWKGYLHQCGSEYPRPEGRFRFEIRLRNPSTHLGNINIGNWAHEAARASRALFEQAWYGNYNFSNMSGPQDCWYACDNWHTLWDIVECDTDDARDCYVMAVQSGEKPPSKLNESIWLYSTFSHLQEVPWEYGVPTKYAFWRNRFWHMYAWTAHQEYERSNGPYLYVDEDREWESKQGVFFDYGAHRNPVPKDAEIVGGKAKRPNGDDAWVYHTPIGASWTDSQVRGEVDRSRVPLFKSNILARLHPWVEMFLCNNYDVSQMLIFADYIEEEHPDHMNLTDYIRCALAQSNTSKPRKLRGFMQNKMVTRMKLLPSMEHFKMFMVHELERFR